MPHGGKYLTLKYKYKYKYSGHKYEYKYKYFETVLEYKYKYQVLHLWYYHVVLTMVMPCGIPWCNHTMACCVIGLQPTTVSFFDCRNCRPMYSAGMWRRFSVAGTQ